MTKQPKEITDIEKEFGETIEQLRISQGLSRRQLAERIDITHQQLQKYEKGINRISLGRLVAICKVLSISASDLLDEYIPDENLKDRTLNIQLMREFNKLNRKQKHNLVVFIRSFNDD